MFSNSHFWESFAKHKAGGRTVAEGGGIRPEWRDNLVLSSEADDFIEFVKREMDEKDLTIKDFTSRQYDVHFSSLNHVEPVLRGLNDFVLTYLTNLLKEDKAAIRADFINQLTKWLVTKSTVGVDNKDGKWKFMASQCVADVDEVASNMLGDAVASALHCGYGATEPLKCLRLSKPPVHAATSGEQGGVVTNVTRGQEGRSGPEVHRNPEVIDDLSKPATKEDLLVEIVHKLWERSFADKRFRQMMGYILKEGKW